MSITLSDYSGIIFCPSGVERMGGREDAVNTNPNLTRALVFSQ